MHEKYWSTIHYHDFDWKKVASTYWKRYPNPNSSHVFSEDLIEAEMDQNGVLRTKRLIMKTNKLPSWGEHLFSTRKVFLIEEAVIQPEKMTIYTRNLNLRLFMGTTEKMTLTPETDAKTKVLKEVWIESEIYGLRSAIKSFGIDRFKKNCLKATEGFDWVLRKAFNKDSGCD